MNIHAKGQSWLARGSAMFALGGALVSLLPSCDGQISYTATDNRSSHDAPGKATGATDATDTRDTRDTDNTRADSAARPSQRPADGAAPVRMPDAARSGTRSTANDAATDNTKASQPDGATASSRMDGGATLDAPDAQQGDAGARDAAPLRAAIDPAASYTVTGSWPDRPIALPQRPGRLVFTKLTVDDRFLAESCSIADYNRDGTPDISAGRRWYEGPFGPNGATKEHIFRAGHDALPRTGAEDELYTGVSDDWACYAQDVDADGYTDIINIACPDVDESKTLEAGSRQHSGTAVWYKNPGASVASTTALWQAHPMHADVRGEQHGLSDVNGDGRPEIYGACKSCGNPDPTTVTRGYYQMDTADPTRAWTYHAVTQPYPWPGGGWLHGFGFGDVNLDGQIDLLERAGVWTHVRASADKAAYYDVRLYAGADDPKAGGSHMFASDVDGDGDADIISADAAHGYGISWYEQTSAGHFTKHKFVGTPQEDFPIHFSQPHAMEVVDMDGDGVSDVIVGKSYLAHPEGLDDPDLRGEPVNYVFKVKRDTPSEAGPVTLEPHPIDTSDAKVGVGRQIAVGHINTDGIMDICIASKLGVYVFLGQ